MTVGSVASPLLLKNTSTLSSVIKTLNPTSGKAETAATIAVDVLFAILSAITVTLLLFGLNFGEMRWFVLPIAIAGYLLYGATVGRPLKAILSFILTAATRFATAVLRFTLYPIVKIFKAAKRKISDSARNRSPKNKPKTTPKSRKKTLK
jgi:hypothetical protein